MTPSSRRGAGNIPDDFLRNRLVSESAWMDGTMLPP